MRFATREDAKEAQKDDEEDPCWEGYEMRGTKTVDGEQVPNCVPVDDES